MAFVYNLFRPLKMTLVVSAADSGAEIIPFLKVWGLIPAAFLFTYFLGSLSKHLERDKVFYSFIAIFQSFFLIFLFFLFPYSDFVRLDSVADALSSIVPLGAQGFVAMLRYWHLSFFYLFAELWSPIMMSVLFWGFANEISSLGQAARFYALFNMAGNMSAIAAGKIGMLFSGDFEFISSIIDLPKWHLASSLIIFIGVIAGSLICVVYYYLNGLPEVALVDARMGGKKLDKVGYSLRESFRHLFQSKYLLYLTVIVLGYNLVFNLTDVLWTDQVRRKFPNSALEMNNYMSYVTMVKGYFSTFLALFVTHNVISKMGWKFAALITPVSILVTSLLFFPLVYIQNTGMLIDVVHELVGTSILSLSVFIGAIQNSVARATKYSVYDATKEIAFIPLSKEMKRKGKAVIDGIGSRLGKSGGSLIYQFLLLFCSSLSATVPYVIVISLIVTVAWVYAVYGLHNEMQAQKIDVNQG